MKNKISRIWILVWITIWIIISWSVFLLFYKTSIKWTREISTWELLSFLIWTIISVLLVYIWNKLSNRVDLREHFIQELSSIEVISMNIEILIKQSLWDADFDKDKFSTLLQWYLKLIWNKIIYINDNSNNNEENKKSLEDSFHKLRDEITENIRNNNFNVNNEYYQLFIRFYWDFIVQVVNYKWTLIK